MPEVVCKPGALAQRIGNDDVDLNTWVTCRRSRTRIRPGASYYTFALAALVWGAVLIELETAVIDGFRIVGSGLNGVAGQRTARRATR